mmetsp:Transcript_34221/g.99356  ORF Transcript_34221/g.99356 Transcript_34221/m.99356 type:complete len:203 (-) Transcript_34221:2265-2873(-)
MRAKNSVTDQIQARPRRARPAGAAQTKGVVEAGGRCKVTTSTAPTTGCSPTASPHNMPGPPEVDVWGFAAWGELPGVKDRSPCSVSPSVQWPSCSCVFDARSLLAPLAPAASACDSALLSDCANQMLFVAFRSPRRDRIDSPRLKLPWMPRWCFVYLCSPSPSDCFWTPKALLAMSSMRSMSIHRSDIATPCLRNSLAKAVA